MFQITSVPVLLDVMKNFLAQTAALLCEGFVIFWELTMSPSSKCADGLVAPKLMNFGAIKPPAHPGNGDGVSSRNFGKPSHNDVAVCARKFR